MVGLVEELCWEGGGLVDSRRMERATMFWQRVEISRRVRSRVGRLPRARVREAREDVMEARR
jgi:hypothetical protein